MKTIQLLTIFVLFTLGACSSHRTDFPNEQRTFPPEVPIYPNARNVTSAIQKDVMEYEMVVTAFDTVDTPKRVVDFYRDQLTEKGWTIHAQTGNEFLIIGDNKGCPFFNLFITVEATGRSSNRVTLKLTQERCVSR